MSNSRLNPDGFYYDSVPIPAGFFQGIDTAQTAGLDGDAGNGTWNPSANIVIGGAGMWACGTWTLSPPSTGTVQVSITSSAPLTHSDSDYITLAASHPLASRTINEPVARGKDASGCPTLQVYTGPNGQTGGIMGPTAVMAPSATALGLGNCAIAGTNYPYRPGGRILLPISDAMHNGATLFNVTFFFIISSQHAGQPDVLPQFRVHKVDIAGNLTPLYTGTGNVAGFVEMTWPGSVSSYKSATSFVYTCDAGVVIDTSKYSYFAEVIDESGANATSANEFLSALPDLASIADMRPQ